MHLVDTHFHLDQEEFDADREAVLLRAKEAGVTMLLAVGVSAASSAAVSKLAAQHSGLYAAVGIHPNYAAQAADGDWARVRELARAPRVVALGETGLDRHWDYTPFPVQQDYFDRHLRLSQEIGLPFIVHMRESEADVMAMLREAAARGPLTGVMHSFTGDAALAEECLTLGLCISFAGMVTFKKSEDLRRVAAGIPHDRILIETDSPYLSPQPLRGKRNEPAHLLHTATCLAEVRGESLTEFSVQTTKNAQRLFRM